MPVFNPRKAFTGGPDGSTGVRFFRGYTALPVLQINQGQSVFLFSMEQKDVAITLWATPAGMRTLTHLLMVSGGLVEVVRMQ